MNRIAIARLLKLALAACLPVSAVHAATFTVTNSNDAIPAPPGSLRWAVQQAEATAAADTIDFDTAGHFSVPRTITLTAGELTITEALTIDAPVLDTRRVTVSGNNAGRIMRFAANGSGNPTAFVIRKLTFTLGDGLQSATLNGGAMEIRGPLNTVTVEDCSFVHNLALSGSAVACHGATLNVLRCSFTANHADGGGTVSIADYGTATITDSTIDGNEALARGGGIEVIFGSCTMVGCTISGNSTPSQGGGIYALGEDSTVSLVNCTISGNSAGPNPSGSWSQGGGIFGIVSAQVEAINCTITGNTASHGGGGICAASTSGIRLDNCIVAGNSAPVAAESDLLQSNGFTIQAQGGNLVGIAPAPPSEFTGALVGTASSPVLPLLGPLADNGGPTKTHALLFGSPAIEAGNSSKVTDPPFPGPSFTDQRGQPRIAGDTVDIGAVELPTLVVENTNNSGSGSFREKVNEANSLGGGTVTFKRSVFNASRQTILLTGGMIDVSTSIAILAPAVGVRLDAVASARVFAITAGTSVFENLHLVNGVSISDGGAMRITGPDTEVRLRRCSIEGCEALSGGAVFIGEGAAMRGMDCAFLDNAATAGSGGAIRLNGINSELFLSNSTLSRNQASENGGGLLQQNGTTTMVNCTVRSNTADSDASGSGNGGGIQCDAGTCSLGNSIVAGNTDLSPAGTVLRDLAGTLVSLGHNLIGRSPGGNGFTHGVNGDQVGTPASPLDPVLGAEVNGYYLPAAGSPVLEAGNNSLLSGPAWLATPEFDQRGQFRIVNATVDIGAAEGPAGPVVRLSVADGRASEQGTEPAKFRLRRSLAAGTSLSVSGLVDGSSTAAASDYTLSGPSYQPSGGSGFLLAFPLDEDTIILTLTPNQDAAAEGTETVAVSLTPIGFSLEPADPLVRSVDILDNDFTVTSAASSGPGTLREAINSANGVGGGKITIPSPLTITLGGTPLAIDGATEIVGNASTISAAGRSRVFEITGDGGGCVKLQGLVITGGRSSAPVPPTTPGGNGGGILIQDACVEMRGCTVTGNQAGGGGGGIHVSGTDASLTIVNSAVTGNTANYGGGGIDALADLALTNVTVALNSAGGDGGGIDAASLLSTVTFTNCTITENTCDAGNTNNGNGGGLFWSSGTVELANTVISNNFDTPGGSGSGTLHPNVSTISGAVATGGGNFIGNRLGAAGLFAAGSPNASADYVGTPGAPLDAQLGYVADLRPFYIFPPSSLLSNQGVNAANSEPNDTRGRPRVAGGTIDIGAVEMNAFMVTNTNNAGAGSFRRAVSDASAVGGDVLFDPAAFPVLTTILLDTEVVVGGAVEVHGLRVGGAPVVRLAGTANRVLKLDPAATARIVVRDLWIRSGGTYTHVAGDRFGGGIFANGNSDLRVHGCVFDFCGSPEDGGGLYVSAGAQAAVFDTSFANCLADRGGAIASLGTLRVERCHFVDQLAYGTAGAIANGGTAAIVNSTFADNHSDGDGGAIHHAALSGETMDIVHCTFTGNRADREGNGTGSGGAIRRSAGPLRLRNSLLAGNFAGPELNPAAPRQDAFGSVTSLGRNLVSAAHPSTGLVHGTNGDQVGTTAVPLPEPLAPFGNHGGPTFTVPVLCTSASRDAGDETGVPATDQRGLPRIHNGAPDIGAYELQPEPYDYWAAHSMGPANAGETDDHDGDGIVNALEYLTGTDPAVADPAPPAATAALEGGFFKFRIGISPLAWPGSHRVRFSTDVQNWNLAPTVSSGIGSQPAADLFEFRRASAVPRMFGRLEYVSPD